MVWREIQQCLLCVCVCVWPAGLCEFLACRTIEDRSYSCSWNGDSSLVSITLPAKPHEPHCDSSGQGPGFTALENQSHANSRASQLN